MKYWKERAPATLSAESTQDKREGGKQRSGTCCFGKHRAHSAVGRSLCTIASSFLTKIPRARNPVSLGRGHRLEEPKKKRKYSTQGRGSGWKNSSGPVTSGRSRDLRNGVELTGLHGCQRSKGIALQAPQVQEK